MAFDLMVGRSLESDQELMRIVGFDFDIQVKVISAMQKRFNSSVLAMFSNPFEDVVIKEGELEKSKDELFKILIHPELRLQEKVILCQIITAITFAIDQNFSLFGVSD